MMSNTRCGPNPSGCGNSSYGLKRCNRSGLQSRQTFGPQRMRANHRNFRRRQQMRRPPLRQQRNEQRVGRSSSLRQMNRASFGRKGSNTGMSSLTDPFRRLSLGSSPGRQSRRPSASTPNVDFSERSAPLQDWRPPLDADPYIGMSPEMKAKAMRDAKMAVQLLERSAQQSKARRQPSQRFPHQRFGSNQGFRSNRF